MQLSAKNREKFERDFNQLDQEAASFLRGSSVALTTGIFHASGVIFAFDNAEGVTWILTAKHNLLLGDFKNPKNRRAPSTMVKAFTDKISILYGPVDFTQKPPGKADLDKTANNGNNTKIFGGPKQDTWDYDVMMLKSRDAKLLEQAKKFAMVKTDEDRNNLDEALSVPGLALKKMEQHTYLQVGFGYSDAKSGVNDKYLNKFQVRYTDPKACAIESVYGYHQKSGFDLLSTNVVRLVADDYSCTAPGDSGGPLFLLDTTESKKPKVFLLGVSLGVNQSLKTKDNVPDLPVVISTSNYVRQFICEAFKPTGGW